MNYSSKSGAIFRLSTLRNEDILISESLEHLPLIRILMIIICFIIGLGTLINLIFIYLKYKLMLRNSIFYRRIIPLILFLNIIFHVAHYTHNIYDPAGYFEPKHLYLKKLISEMEQTFLFNFPLSILFFFTTQKLLLSSCITKQSNDRYMFIITIVYCFMSMISGGHYTYEPPWNYPLIYNITIAGETIVAFILLMISLFIYRTNSNKSINYRYTKLSTNDKQDSNIEMSIVQERQWKSKMSDNE